MDTSIRESIRRKYDPITNSYKGLTTLELTSLTTTLAREIPNVVAFEGGLTKGKNQNPADFLIEPRRWNR